jgi:hypothetical protein
VQQRVGDAAGGHAGEHARVARHPEASRVEAPVAAHQRHADLHPQRAERLRQGGRRAEADEPGLVGQRRRDRYDGAINTF